MPGPRLLRTLYFKAFGRHRISNNRYISYRHSGNNLDSDTAGYQPTNSILMLGCHLKSSSSWRYVTEFSLHEIRDISPMVSRHFFLCYLNRLFMKDLLYIFEQRPFITKISRAFDNTSFDYGSTHVFSIFCNVGKSLVKITLASNIFVTPKI